MGLSGRKEKQRIPNDPRNLAWADDAAKFGQSYLSKLGWDPSRGLGAEGEGRTSHISVSHKLDLLGIGAGAARSNADPDAIAWRQNKDFENLLARLNAANNQEGENAVAEEVVGEKNDALEVDVDETVTKQAKKESKSKKEKRSKSMEGESKAERKKRKRTNEDGEEETKEERKQRRREKKARKAAADTTIESEDKDTKKKRRKSKKEEPTAAVVVAVVPVFVPRVRAHRARVQASKNIASKSAAHIAEILGVAPSSAPATPAAGAQGQLTSTSDEKHDKLTTATVSAEDYFRQKLLARSQGGSAATSGVSTPTIMPLITATTTMGLGAGSRADRNHNVDEEEEATRRGLGLGFKASAW